jgi:hypothetical protein
MMPTVMHEAARASRRPGQNAGTPAGGWGGGVEATGPDFEISCMTCGFALEQLEFSQPQLIGMVIKGRPENCQGQCPSKPVCPSNLDDHLLFDVFFVM